MQGGLEKAVPPMPLKEYRAAITAQFKKRDEKEIAVGLSAMGMTAWRDAFGPILESMSFAG